MLYRKNRCRQKIEEYYEKKPVFFIHNKHNKERISARDGTLVGYTFSKRYKKVSPHRKSHNLLYNLLKEKNKPPQEMVNKRGVPFGPTWLTRTLARI